MLKKFVSLALASAFMLSLSVSAHAAATPSASQEEARLATVFPPIPNSIIFGNEVTK